MLASFLALSLPSPALASSGAVIGIAVAVVALVVVIVAITTVTHRRRLNSRPSGSFADFLHHVEPALAATPRVSVVAETPIISNDDAVRAVPLTVGIVGDPRTDAEAIAATQRSLDQQTVDPQTVVVGPARELLSTDDQTPLLLVDAGDVLAPLAVERFGQALTLAPSSVAVVSSDEDQIDVNNARRSPRLSQGPSVDGQLTRGACGGVVLVRPNRVPTDLLDDPQLSRRRLATVMAGRDARGHGHIPLFLLHRADGRPHADTGWDRPWQPTDAEAALAAYGVSGGRAETTHAGLVRVRFALPSSLPSVEVIVLYRDKPELTERCVRSVLDRTTYGGPLRVQLVDNGSTDPNVPPMVERLTADDRVVSVRDDQPFNYAALNNAAVGRSDAEVLVLLNNDTEVRTPTWVEDMLEYAQQPDVGAVGALLVYDDGSVQHAGAALGLHGFAGHPFQGRRPDERTALGTAADGPRTWLAVTAACLMVRRDAWDAVNGFDEGFVVAGNDVDLCLRLTASGRRSVCLPHVVLLHDESKSRGGYVDPGDYAASERSYGTFRTVGDPFYSPALTLGDSSVVLRGPGT